LVDHPVNLQHGRPFTVWQIQQGQSNTYLAINGPSISLSLSLFLSIVIERERLGSLTAKNGPIAMLYLPCCIYSIVDHSFSFRKKKRKTWSIDSLMDL
jgi:hypothetical protein